MLVDSRYRSRAGAPRPTLDRRPAGEWRGSPTRSTRVGAVSYGGGLDAPTATVTPLKSEPTLVTKQDLYDYVGMLMPLIKGLDADLMANTYYMNPDVEQGIVETDLAQAKALDGCDEGLGCPGWRDTDPEPPITDVAATKARKLRRDAFQHRVNARLMEDRIKERGGATNAQIAAENALWAEWLAYVARFKANLKTIDDVAFVKSSDWQNMQQLDLQLQAYRQRYQKLTGKAPSTPLTPRAPKSTEWYESIPWGGIGAIAGLFGVGYVLSGLHR